MSSTLHIGVLSTANIGVEKVIPALQASDRCEVAAIGSRRADTVSRGRRDGRWTAVPDPPT